MNSSDRSAMGGLLGTSGMHGPPHLLDISHYSAEKSWDTTPQKHLGLSVEPDAGAAQPASRTRCRYGKRTQWRASLFALVESIHRPSGSQALVARWTLPQAPCSRGRAHVLLGTPPPPHCKRARSGRGHTSTHRSYQPFHHNRGLELPLNW